jgi:hypothetical protein
LLANPFLKSGNCGAFRPSCDSITSQPLGPAISARQAGLQTDNVVRFLQPAPQFGVEIRGCGNADVVHAPARAVVDLLTIHGLASQRWRANAAGRCTSGRSTAGVRSRHEPTTGIPRYGPVRERVTFRTVLVVE